MRHLFSVTHGLTTLPSDGQVRGACALDCPDINATVNERDSDMGGGAVYHDNRVRVEKSAW